jgi:hypothetical protein
VAPGFSGEHPNLSVPVASGDLIGSFAQPVFPMVALAPFPSRVDLRVLHSSKSMKSIPALNQENPRGQQKHDLPLV